MDDACAYQQMLDEMSRFEAEISGVEYALTPVMRPLIAAGTFGVVQQQLHKGALAPPPPPAFLGTFNSMAPRMMFSMRPTHVMIPHQVQRLRHPTMTQNMSFNMPPSGQDFSQFMGPNMPGPQMIPPQPKPQPAVFTAAPKLYKQTRKQDDEKTSEPKKKRVEKPVQVEEPESTPVTLNPEVSTITTMPIEAPPKTKKEKKSRKVVRTAGGQVWEDVTLLDWPDDDFRMFCGDLGNDVSDELLTRTFGKYSSFQRAKVIRDKRTNKSKGFGFVSFKEPTDFIKAMKEMDGRYVGSRPIKLRKSTWRNRALDVVRKKEKDKAALLSLLMTGGKG